jgi:lambda family phage tail tape measure protein
MANIARLGVVLGIDSAEFTTGIAAAKKTVSELADKMKVASTIAVGAFTAMAYKAMEYADRMQDTAKANEVGIASVLQLSRALQQNGGESENAGKFLSSFTAHIDSAAQGSKTAQDAFKRVGVSLKDLASMSNEELMKKTLEGLNAMPDVVSRNAVAMTTFGKAAKNVDLKGMLDDMQQVNPEFEAHAKAVEIAGNMHDRLQKSADQLTLTFTQGVFPAINDIATAFSDVGEKGDKALSFFTLIGDAGRVMASGLQTIATGFDVLFTQIGYSLDVGRLIKNWDWKKFEEDAVNRSNTINQIYTDGAEKQKTIWGKQSEYAGKSFDYVEKLTARDIASLKGHTQAIKAYLKAGMISEDDVSSLNVPRRTVTQGKATADSSAADRAAEKAAREAQHRAEELRLAERINKEFEGQESIKLKLIQHSGEMLSMTNDERKLATALLQIDDDRERKIEDINKQLDKERAKSDKDPTKSQAVIDQLEKQKTLVSEVAEKYRKLTQDELASQRTLQNSFKFGWTNAFNQFLEDAKNDSKLASDMFSSMTNNMNSFLDNFVRTGKLNFGDFAKSIIQDLIAIQLKMSAMKMISAFAGSFGGGSPAGSEAAAWQTGNFKANGGTVSAGSPVIVGERGPELFFPSRSGAVIPNNDMMASMSGGGGDTYNGTVIQNMSAIDTQSAMQFIASNKNAIFSANQSAARSMPTSR